ncbi:hypothetical protein Hypma_006161 [Hypsizygus marmoreus]|uniref:Uncharacterized protein n=1 Tax=Hypsizygus marmoreus TaxID=39966 RepID=A0A369JWM0_HYPMA|nr:hypothetical protein Hypma_006161 [Hypsizygus marmoreus]
MSGYRFHSLFEVPYVESLRFHAGIEAEAQNRDIDAEDAPLIIRLPGLETTPPPYARNILNVAGNMSIDASAEQHSLTSQDYALKTSFDHGGNSAMHGDIRPVPLHATKITPDARDLCHRWGSSTRAIRGSVGRDTPVEQSSDVDGNEDHVHLNTQGASSSFFADEDRGQVPGGLGSNSDRRETRGKDSIANYVSVPHNAFQRRGHLDGSDSDDSDEDNDSDRTLIFNLDDTSSETLFSSSVEHDSSDEEEDWSDGEDWDSDPDPDSDEVHLPDGAERNDADVEGQLSIEDGDDDEDDDDDADQFYTPVVRTRGLWR